MAQGEGRIVGRDDLIRAVRAVATHFEAERVHVVGSTALLVGRPDLDRSLRNSHEFDIYPDNAKEWEASQKEKIEASEEIDAFFGFGSEFHKSFGFYIDGVDEKTAKLPPD